jgi:hypothetical protein
VTIRGLFAIILLVPALTLERSAYYGQRSITSIFLHRLGHTSAEVSTAYTSMVWVTLLFMFAGAGLAIAIGPRWTAVIGAVIAMTGSALLAASAPPLLGLIVVSIGTGIFRTCPYAAVADIVQREEGMSPRRFSIMTAATIAMYGASNIAAASGSPVFATTFEKAGSAATFGSGAALFFMAAIVMVVAALVAPKDTTRSTDMPGAPVYRAPAPPPLSVAAPSGPSPVIVALGVVGIGAVLFSAATDFGSPAPRWVVEKAGLSYSSVATLYTLNPTVAIPVSGICFVVWTIFAAMRRPAVPLGMGAVGLLVLGIGVVPAACGTSMVILGFGVIIAAIGEVMAGPVLGAYAALAIPSRLRSLGVAAYFGISMIVTTIGNLLEASSVGVVFAILSGLAAVAGGAVGIALAKRAHRAFDSVTP